MARELVHSENIIGKSKLGKSEYTTILYMIPNPQCNGNLEKEKELFWDRMSI